MCSTQNNRLILHGQSLTKRNQPTLKDIFIPVTATDSTALFFNLGCRKHLVNHQNLKSVTSLIILRLSRY